MTVQEAAHAIHEAFFPQYGIFAIGVQEGKRAGSIVIYTADEKAVSRVMEKIRPLAGGYPILVRESEPPTIGGPT